MRSEPELAALLCAVEGPETFLIEKLLEGPLGKAVGKIWRVVQDRQRPEGILH